MNPIVIEAIQALFEAVAIGACIGLPLGALINHLERGRIDVPRRRP